MGLFSNKRIYLDYAAATPILPEVRRVMEKCEREEWYNPSAIYKEGVAARRTLESVRERVARLVKAGTRDIVFTSGGTEADNLAILGTFEKAREKIAKPHLIVWEHDHAAIVEAAREAERRGARLTILPLNDDGLADLTALRETLTPETVLVSVSYVMSGTGVIQPVSKIGRLIREYRRERESAYPYFHIDASQAANCLDLNVESLRADLLTLDSGKIYGPRGVGALIVRPTATIRPCLLGGGQERGLRAGTENVPALVGFAKALEIAVRDREAESVRLAALRKKFTDQVVQQIKEAIVSGAAGSAAPQIASVSIPGALHEFLVIKLDKLGILISGGSACGSRKSSDEPEALRFSFGRQTTESDVSAALAALQEAVRR